ncbi:DNA-binding transcriptional regulator, MarR family [Cognatiyoonia sediminum]|uniref:DNA-binding transcriptional regulator, MarR family n=1 Tax=Cognatiyoonia sediminum TaxID=1508389 RepID=A0A1M5QKY3_9RHOB|nr:MarR family transcriptional regulator [Cognatiyoonia sediminum]SHH14469.1 DNA-binding transcriptional regulator, MarR family [Cognatiyoonia sediminum]
MTSPKPRTWKATPNTATRIVAGLFRSRNYVWNNDHKVAEQHGITWTQFLILRALRFTNEALTLTPTQLYEAAQASSSGTAKMLAGLAEMGLIERFPNPDDARSTLARLTEKGADLTEQIVDELIEMNTALFDGVLTTEEREQLADLLGKLSAELRERV